MYNVNVAGSTSEASSYENAVKAAKSALAATAQNIRTNTRFLRSPKARTALAASVLKATFPKKAGNVTRTIGGIVPVTISRA